MEDKPAKYHSFLIRLWKVRQNGTFVWRASIENPQTEEILGFENLQSLFIYLGALTSGEANED